MNEYVLQQLDVGSGKLALSAVRRGSVPPVVVDGVQHANRLVLYDRQIVRSLRVEREQRPSWPASVPIRFRGDRRRWLLWWLARRIGVRRRRRNFNVDVAGGQHALLTLFVAPVEPVVVDLAQQNDLLVRLQVKKRNES